LRTIDGIPVTAPERVMVDYGAVGAFDDLVYLADEFINRRLSTWHRIMGSYLAHKRQGRTGCGPLRALLNERYGAAVTESRIEDQFERLLRHADVLLAERQVWITLSDAQRVRVDFAYPALKIAIEIDSVQHHNIRGAFERDKTKRNRLRLDGWLVLEITYQMMKTDPMGVILMVLEALDLRAAA
jgi:very-short-patch-repair endonuclease